VRVFAWTKSKNRWRRRAAAVALIRSARKKMFFDEIRRVTDLLRDDQDDMVQKGLGWLLRETAKYDPQRTVPFLVSMRGRLPRLVLRTACETLPANHRTKVMSE
jgi:3-methyladenine DNA glycosylase AlkD